VRPVAIQIVVAMREAALAGRAVPWGPALAMLASGDAAVVAQGRDPAATLNAPWPGTCPGCGTSSPTMPTTRIDPDARRAQPGRAPTRR
jgi:hypothetical protein